MLTILQKAFWVNIFRFGDSILDKTPSKIFLKNIKADENMPKKGIAASNETSLVIDRNKELVFDYLNSLKPNGATRAKICKKTSLSESTVKRILAKLKSEEKGYGYKHYAIKKEGHTYKVEVFDEDGKVIDYSKMKVLSNYEELERDLMNTNGLNEKEAVPINEAVILYPAKKRCRNQIKTLLMDYYKTDIKDVIPIDRGLYILLSTDDKERFEKTKENLITLYSKTKTIG